jgi:hypothetical protein
MSDFIPTKDADLLTWAQAYSDHITATPIPFGLTAAIATVLAGYVTGYQTALAAATNGSTRGKATVLAKDNAKRTLVLYIRQTAKQIQGTMTVTDEQRQDLGLPIPKQRAPIPAPGMSPDIDILSTFGNTVRLKVHNSTSGRRGKPPGVASITLFSFVGAVPPTEAMGWHMEGSTTKNIMDVVFPGSVEPGAKVWFTAFYANAKEQSGPASAPVGTNLPGGAAMAA